MSAEIIPLLRMEQYPNRIYEMRKARGLSQEVVGQALGVTKMTVSRIERGLNEPDLGQLRTIATLFRCTVADLLSDADNPDRLDDSEKTLFHRYRSAEPDQRRNIQAVTEALVPFGHAPKRNVA